MMTPEELLRPRYKVIAQYPFSPHPNGEIIKATTGTYFDQYPHLFKKLEWWEDRQPEDMPEYVEYVPVFPSSEDKFIKANGWFFYDMPSGGQMIGIRTPGGIMGAHCLLPATEQEYLEYIKQKEG